MNAGGLDWPIRARIAGLEPQRIVEVSTLGHGDSRVVPLWFGEGDLATPDFISEAAAAALRAGETFYTPKRGIPELREAIAAYMSDLYRVEIGAERVTVTPGGMSAIMLVEQMLVDPGDNVVVVSPVWPNAFAVPQILGGEARPVALDRGDNGWSLDLDRLFGAVDGRTRAIFVNSPNNPTGWVMPREQQAALLDFARRRGVWIIADEVYGRIVYDGRAAPSFLEIAAPDDPVLAVNSFSKSWAMTGWRIGWLTTPAAVGDPIAELVEYNTSGTTSFAQHGALAAVRGGEAFVAEFVARCRTGRDLVCGRLARHPRIRLVSPEAAFYAFFAVEGMADSVALARRLVLEAGVGLAPGAAFGPGGEGSLRLCFASAPDRLETALDRLEAALDA